MERKAKIENSYIIERFRVGHLLATVHTLKKLHLDVRENALTDQITGAFGPKLKELHITGKNLKDIDSKTFRGFQNRHELLLSITVSVRMNPCVHACRCRSACKCV